MDELRKFARNSWTVGSWVLTLVLLLTLGAMLGDHLRSASGLPTLLLLTLLALPSAWLLAPCLSPRQGRLLIRQIAGRLLPAVLSCNAIVLLVETGVEKYRYDVPFLAAAQGVLADTCELAIQAAVQVYD